MNEDEQYYAATKANFLESLNTAEDADGLGSEIGDIEVSSVLDVGCGIGQALYPLAVAVGASGVGIDVSEESLRIGQTIYLEKFPNARVLFVRSMAETLPFENESFDLLNCGLALPYMDNALAISEMARVMRPGGVLLLKIHHPRFYFGEIVRGLKGAGMSPIIHGSRVLAAGTVYHVFGRQPRFKPLHESYQTEWMLRRELPRHGLSIERPQKKTNAATPAFVIKKAV
ncbi:MAG: class I SAM-dependent methyltransferase [Pyrinomonadaceae bacterium]|nr:class I SAM-dependent methyltransferase [Pyrinomonadaceae bacterium]